MAISVSREAPIRRRRVLLVSNTVMHYRMSVYNYFHRRFAENGWEWMVVADQIQPQNKIEPEFQIETLPFGFWAYRRRIKELKPDTVILFLHFKDRILWPLVHWLKLSGIPFIIWSKTRNLDTPNRRITNACFDYINSLCSGLIIYTPNLAKYLTTAQQRKAFTAPNTINDEQFPRVTEDSAAIKRSLGIPFRKVVLFVGRMNVDGGRKRVDHLIEIFREIGDRDAGLVIVGSGMKPEWHVRMNPRTTMYLGEVHDPENRQIARIFTMADVCAIPGHVGLGLNQALLFGLPVVTMEGNQPPEICYLHHGENGFLVPEDDVAALRRRIFELLDDDALRQQFSTAARQTYSRDASIEGMFRGFRDCVEFVTGAARQTTSSPASSSPSLPTPTITSNEQ